MQFLTINYHSSSLAFCGTELTGELHSVHTQREAGTVCDSDCLEWRLSVIQARSGKQTVRNAGRKHHNILPVMTCGDL